MQMFEFIAKDLKIVTQCNPEDKLLLVIGLKAMGKVVTVTGKDANDIEVMQAADAAFCPVKDVTNAAIQHADGLLLENSLFNMLDIQTRMRGVFENIQKSALQTLPFCLTCAITLPVTLGVIG